MSRRVHYKFVFSSLFLLIVVALSVFIIAPRVFAVPGADWTLETASAFSSPRQNAELLNFDRKLWAIGGRNSSGYLNEVWWSTDGITWTQVVAPPWPPRWAHSLAVFQNVIWLIGGSDGTSNLGDIWTSGDGQTWNSVSGGPYPWGKRRGHTLVVFGGDLYLIGGLDEFGDRKNDVWKTSDGVNWQLVTNTAPWEDTTFDNALVYKNEIWLLGSWPVSKNVWHSSDGQNWGSYIANWPQARGGGSSSVVYDNKLWIMGGQEAGVGYVNNVWHSSDGQTWTDPNNGAGADWPNRIEHSSVVFLNKMWIIGGHGGSSTYFNDAWSSQ